MQVRGHPSAVRAPLSSSSRAFPSAGFLTPTTTGAGLPHTSRSWASSLGGLLGCLDRVLMPLGALSAALGTLGASLLLTGAFHEDGLADTSDALGGGFDREKILVILKDSRIGAFGACALVLSIAGRGVLLARLGFDAAWALPLVGAAARMAPVWQIAALPYVASPASRSRGVAQAGVVQACVASAWAGAVGLAMAATGHFAAARIAGMFAAVAVTTLVSGWRYARRLGGVTGDFLGATEQLCELAGYGALAWGLA